MKTNRKQKLSIILLVFSVIIGGIFFLHYSNRPKQFNVLLITIDALRPDHLGCYGYRRNTSPNIDTIAKEGIMFTQAIAPSSSTISSTPSIMTSTYPHTHRIWNFGDLLDNSVITLAKILKDNNFYTGMITAQLFPHFKIGKDFITKIIRLDAQADKVTDWAIYWLTKNQNKNEGTSLLPFILQNKGRISRHVLSEYFEGTSFKFAIRKEEWKLIYNNENNYELYNLKNDPQELDNLVLSEKEKFEFLKQILGEYIDETVNTRREKTKIFLEEDEKEQLKSLGYIQ